MVQKPVRLCLTLTSVDASVQPMHTQSPMIASIKIPYDCLHQK